MVFQYHDSDWSAMASVTFDTRLSDLVRLNPSAVDVLERYGLGCACCMGAEFETVRDACAAHEIDGEKLLADLGRVLDQDDLERSS